MTVWESLMKSKHKLLNSEKYQGLWRPCDHKWGTSCLDIYKYGDDGELNFKQSLKFNRLKDAEAHFEEKYT